jgi:hypothetical protein
MAVWTTRTAGSEMVTVPVYIGVESASIYNFPIGDFVPYP